MQTPYDAALSIASDTAVGGRLENQDRCLGRVLDPSYSLWGLRGEQIDRCVLYVFRCAVYYAANETHESEKLKWWNWKDE